MLLKFLYTFLLHIFTISVYKVFLWQVRRNDTWYVHMIHTVCIVNTVIILFKTFNLKTHRQDCVHSNSPSKIM